LASREEMTAGRVLRICTAAAAGQEELDPLRVAVAELASEVLVEQDRPLNPHPPRARARVKVDAESPGRLR
jgi:hypothetical protein